MGSWTVRVPPVQQPLPRPDDDPDRDGFSNKEGELGQKTRQGLGPRRRPPRGFPEHPLFSPTTPNGLDLNDTIVHADKPAGELVGIFNRATRMIPTGKTPISSAS